MTTLADLIPDHISVRDVDGYLDVLPPEEDAQTGPFEGVYGAMYTAVLNRPALLRPIARAVWGSSNMMSQFEQTVSNSVSDLGPDSVLLDVPCGGGTTFAVLEKVGYTGCVVGADLSATMLARAVRRTQSTNLHVELLRCDALNLPLRDCSVDGVLSINGLHCMPSPRRFLESLFRVLKPGRTAWMTTLVSGASRRSELANAWAQRHGVLPQQPPEHDALLEMAASIGFVVEDLGGAGVVGVALVRPETVVR